MRSAIRTIAILTGLVAIASAFGAAETGGNEAAASTVTSGCTSPHDIAQSGAAASKDDPWCDDGSDAQHRAKHYGAAGSSAGNMT